MARWKTKISKLGNKVCIHDIEVDAFRNFVERKLLL